MFDKISLLFKNLRKNGIIRLGITGGEPLLRKDIGKIIFESKKNNFFTSLNTNLTLYEKNIEVFDNVDFVFTSLDGNRENHELKRGQDSFKNILPAIAKIRSNKIPVVAISVVDEDSEKNIDETLRMAKDYNFKVHFQVRGTEELSYTTDLSRGSFKIDFNNQSYREIWKKILAYKKNRAPIACSEKYIEEIIKWQDYREFNIQDINKKCAAGYGFIYITSNGFAYPCCTINKRTAGIDMTTTNWKRSFHLKKPCSKCIAGPYLQFNLLYEKPISTLWDLYSMYPIKFKRKKNENNRYSQS